VRRWLLLTLALLALGTLALKSGEALCKVEWQAKSIPDGDGGHETIYFEVPCEDRNFLLTSLLYLDQDPDSDEDDE
jgi:hypothetical protein